MKIISSYTILSILIINMCAGNNSSNSPKLNINPPDVIAVPGVCALISCNFTYPETKPVKNITWKVYNIAKKDFGKKSEKKGILENITKRIKMLEPDLTKNNCSFIMKDIKKADDKKEYAFGLEGEHSNQLECAPRVKIIIQDKPKLKIPDLIKGMEAKLTCSAPFPCPETPPEITWWILTREKDIIDLNDNKITLTTSNRVYLSTLTLNLTSDLHDATVGCHASYGTKNIRTCGTLEVKGVTIKETTNESTTANENQLNPIGIEDLIKTLDRPMVLMFVAGMACSALIFSMILCCWLSCCRGKKHKVSTANPDSDINLEIVQTDVAQTGINEQTPLHEEAEDETQTPAAPAAPADEAEQEEADGTAGRETDYASIDYSLLKNREPEEEKEPVNTDYAEIKKDRMKSEALEDEDDQTPPPDQNQTDGDEELYSNSQMMKSPETDVFRSQDYFSE